MGLLSKVSLSRSSRPESGDGHRDICMPTSRNISMCGKRKCECGGNARIPYPRKASQECKPRNVVIGLSFPILSQQVKPCRTTHSQNTGWSKLAGRWDSSAGAVLPQRVALAFRPYYTRHRMGKTLSSFLWLFLISCHHREKGAVGYRREFPSCGFSIDVKDPAYGFVSVVMDGACFSRNPRCAQWLHKKTSNERGPAIASG